MGRPGPDLFRLRRPDHAGRFCRDLGLRALPFPAAGHLRHRRQPGGSATDRILDHALGARRLCVDAAGSRGAGARSDGLGPRPAARGSRAPPQPGPVPPCRCRRCRPGASRDRFRRALVCLWQRRCAAVGALADRVGRAGRRLGWPSSAASGHDMGSTLGRPARRRGGTSWSSRPICGATASVAGPWLRGCGLDPRRGATMAAGVFRQTRTGRRAGLRMEEGCVWRGDRRPGGRAGGPRPAVRAPLPRASMTRREAGAVEQ